jgi:putative endonuclease
MKPYYVYILASKRNGTLVGLTTGLIRRTNEHKDHVNPGFTSEYDVKRLVWYETHEDITEAIKREKQLKKWRRKWNLDLIEETNPTWDDLYDSLS